MKVGDLVRWKSSNMGTSIDEEYRGIIVDGPRARRIFEKTRGRAGLSPIAAASWKVAWFHQDPYWHNDYCLEILNENW